MIDKIQESINAINENLSILPTETKKNKAEYIKYIDSELNEYNNKLKEIEKELEDRYQKYLKKYTSGPSQEMSDDMDIISLKYSNGVFDSYERMNLSYYVYEIGHYYKEDLDKVNEIILSFIDSFSKVGINLTISDFNYTDVVNKYMTSLLNKNEDIHAVFESLYWENPTLINQIELSFRYLYFKYKRKIDKYFKKHVPASINVLDKHRELSQSLKNYKHTSIKYISSLILEKKVPLVDVSEKNIKSISTELLLEENDSNYDNLLKLEDTLLEYKDLMHFMYIIEDMKKLFEHKQEYKGIYLNKYKEIQKKEKELFKLNKKANKNGESKLNRNNCIVELYKLYRELDDLKINDTIYNQVSDDTSYYVLLSLVTLDFNYFVKLLKEQKDNITMEDIDNNLNKLFKFVYGNELNIVNNISISEDKNIAQIISDRYRLININVNEEKISEEAIDSYLKSLGNLILSYDIAKNNINVEELDYIMYVDKMKEK